MPARVERRQGGRGGRAATTVPHAYDRRMNDAPPIRATYRLLLDPAESAEETAAAIAREQTLEVPSGAATPEIEAAYLGRVETIVPAEDHARAVHVTIAYPADLFDGALTQFLNVVWGNVSLMDDVLLESVDLPEWALEHFPGPRFGIEGVRRLAGGTTGRPLVASALKPVGLDVDELAELARRLARAGVDVIKDDHGLTDQRMAPFEDRAARVAEAVREVNARTGGHTLYFPNVTGAVEVMPERAAFAAAQGCAGAVVSAGLVGLDAVRALRTYGPDLAIMAHPSHANTSPNATRGIAPDLLMGTLWRLAGADCVVYVNARGRFAWPVEACLAVNAAARAPLGGHAPAFPVPAGGIQAAEVDHWFDLYGPETLLLIGGSILEADDVEGSARAVVEAARAAGATGT